MEAFKLESDVIVTGYGEEVPTKLRRDNFQLNRGEIKRIMYLTRHDNEN
jgi:hypothetical protein